VRLRILAVLIGVFALSAGTLAGSGQAVTGANHRASIRAEIPVSITEFAFTPNRLMAHVGDTVKWTNNGGVSHTTSAKGNVWNSGTLTPGATFSFTFTTTGVFKYRCQIHPTLMQGSIKVVP
jgi:plastocyanin